MSSDSAKEIASLLDSSVTECKKDTLNMHDPASPRGRSDEEARRSGAEEQVQSCGRVETSSEMKKRTINNTRYFIIKSLNHQNIQLSIKKGIWATQVMNERILEETFQNSGKVILIFSVNMSGFFQGYAQMMSSVGWRRDQIWSQGSGKNNPWGRSFKVKWLRLYDLPFQKTLHLKNPWNDYKPVKISRDCQELPHDIGEALCELLDSGHDMKVNLKRDDVSGDNFPERRPFAEPNVDFYAPPVHMGSPFYPSLPYQYQTGASPFDLPHHRTNVMNSSSVVPGMSKVKQPNRGRIDGSPDSRMYSSSQVDSWGLSAERSLLSATFTDDDILDMTYEEYLEAHSRCSRRLDHSAAGRTTSLQKSSSSKDRSDDSHSASSRSKKRSCRQSLKLYSSCVL